MSIVTHFSVLGFAVGVLIGSAAVLAQVVQPPINLAGIPSKHAVEIYKDSNYLPHPCAYPDRLLFGPTRTLLPLVYASGVFSSRKGSVTDRHTHASTAQADLGCWEVPARSCLVQSPRRDTQELSPRTSASTVSGT